MTHPSRAFLAVGVVLTALSAAATTALPPGQGLVPTTLKDFFQPGTQPGEVTDDLLSSDYCMGCHGNYDLNVEPFRRWASSMMAQATRDPIFHAALAIAEQDADFAGDLCLRCHTPTGWVGGRSIPTDGSALDQTLGDFDGINCNFCHRMVDPVFEAGNPAVDASILAGLTAPPTAEPHSGQYVLDPLDRRRGPFDLGPGFFWHEWEQSSFHQDSLMCATCHDVSNPVFSRQPDGTYAMNTLDLEHPTQEKTDEFPVERTYSEWTESVYAKGELEMAGRFGGNKTAVASCQDCHMEDASGTACMPSLGGAVRDDLPLHDMNGSNSWVLRAIRYLYPDVETQLTQQLVDDSIARNISMLERAADLETFLRDGQLVARVVNRTGHKLPTGYGEGRRMWLNVRFLDAGGVLIEERGAYDAANAELDTASTQVYEIEHGIDAAVSAATGVPVGPSFHFVLNNVTEKDNRIPPRGYDSYDFETIQSAPVGQIYAEQHFWDDVAFDLPPGTETVEVNLFHQTTTKEYITFLRDENTTNAAGQLAYDMWDLFGQSAPVQMAQSVLDLDDAACPQPVEYGIAKLSSQGLRPQIGYTGSPSRAAGNFVITLEDAVPNSWGSLFFGANAQEAPFGGGDLLVANPLRGPVFNTGPSGQVSLPITISLAMVDTRRYYQILFRDYFDAQRLGLTGGLYVEFCD